jgi:hypothetical protein
MALAVAKPDIPAPTMVIFTTKSPVDLSPA